MPGLQVENLTNLRRLHLRGRGVADYFDVLTSLPTLTELVLITAGGLPACLSRLTQLRLLHLAATPFSIGAEGDDMEEFEDWEAELEVPLRQLTELTRLYVVDPPPAVSLPSTLARLRQLQRFGWLGGRLEDRRLPEGPWLRQLRQLSLPTKVLQINNHVWSQATHLEYLRLEAFFSSATAALASGPAILTRAGALPALRKVRLDCAGERTPEPSRVQQAAAGLLATNPSIEIEVLPKSAHKFCTDDDGMPF